MAGKIALPGSAGFGQGTQTDVSFGCPSAQGAERLKFIKIFLLFFNSPGVGVIALGSRISSCNIVHIHNTQVITIFVLRQASNVLVKCFALDGDVAFGCPSAGGRRGL